MSIHDKYRFGTSLCEWWLMKPFHSELELRNKLNDYINNRKMTVQFIYESLFGRKTCLKESTHERIDRLISIVNSYKK